MKGTVKFYNRKQNFGFIVGDDNKEYYFNASSLVLPKENEIISFEPEQNKKGLIARSIVQPHAKSKSGRSTVVIAAVVGLVIGIGLGALI